MNPENGLVERTRSMRGEDIAYAYLYLGEKDMPNDEWGYRYRDALEYLKNCGVQHIVAVFPQVLTDSVLTLVEVYNQIGKEIGVKTWLQYKEGDYKRYPGCGHPFADFWGNWVDTRLENEWRQGVLHASDGRPMALGPGPSRMDQSLALKEVQVRRFGDDLLITGYPDYP